MPAVLTNSRSAAPRPTTLVSPVTIRAPAFAAARAADAVIAPQLLERQPLLDDVGERDRDRLGAHHRQVVDRAVDGQLADVPARERERADTTNESVVNASRCAADLDDRGVVERAARRRRRRAPAR